MCTCKKNTIIRTTLVCRRKKVLKIIKNNINCVNTMIKIFKIFKISDKNIASEPLLQFRIIDNAHVMHV